MFGYEREEVSRSIETDRFLGTGIDAVAARFGGQLDAGPTVFIPVPRRPASVERPAGEPVRSSMAAASLPLRPRHGLEPTNAVGP